MRRCAYWKCRDKEGAGDAWRRTVESASGLLALVQRAPYAP